MDFKEHNKRAKEVWNAYYNGSPFKVPVFMYADARNWIFEKDQNTQGITLWDYVSSPDIMFEVQVKAQEWIRLNIISDSQMGYPSEEEGWSVRIDFENFTELAWLGGEAEPGTEPHVRPFLNDDDKHKIFDKGIPAAFDGFGKVVQRYYEYFVEKSKTYLYKGIPVKSILMPYNFYGTDGIFTTACGLRGMTNLINDIFEDPDYVENLLDFITEAIISRMKEVRRYLGEEIKSKNFGYADDAIVLLSPSLFKQLVLPRIKRVYDEFTLEGGRRSIHLCGDAQRFFPILQKECGVVMFDTGYPIDFEHLYDELHPDTEIWGGPSVVLLKNGSPLEVKNEVRRILQIVMPKTKKFVLRDANALIPGTPIENVRAVYEACEEWGYYGRLRGFIL